MTTGIAGFFLALFVIGCAKVPVTGRKQLNLLSTDRMMSMSLDAYKQFLDSNQQKVLPDEHKKVQMVRRIGNRIAESARKYLKENGQKKRIKDFDWEFNVVQDAKVNAFAMSGGKVVFYTGIIDVAQGPAGVAVVMGHEISHAIARHANERMSDQMAIKLGAASLGVATRDQPELTRKILLQSYGVASKLGALKFSRKHESEADKMGLVFMAKAGYDPREAVDFWKRMDKAGGQEPPEFLSTHPNHDTRVQDLKDYMPKALKYYDN